MHLPGNKNIISLSPTEIHMHKEEYPPLLYLQWVMYKSIDNYKWISDCTWDGIKQIHIFSSLSSNNTHIPICTLKELLITVIIPRVYTGCDLSLNLISTWGLSELAKSSDYLPWLAFLYQFFLCFQRYYFHWRRWWRDSNTAEASWALKFFFAQSDECGFCPPSLTLKMALRKDLFSTDRRNNYSDQQCFGCTYGH